VHLGNLGRLAQEVLGGPRKMQIEEAQLGRPSIDFQLQLRPKSRIQVERNKLIYIRAGPILITSIRAAQKTIGMSTEPDIFDKFLSISLSAGEGDE